MIPAAQVGGDLFDFFLLDPWRLAFTIGDVSGKGIGAAIFMAVSRTVLRVVASKTLRPHECMQEANVFLCAERKLSSIFVTCFYGILDLETGALEYSRAGHNPPCIVEAAADGGPLKTLDTASGFPLGLFGSAAFDTAALQLQPGDMILLFTDGVTECMNHQCDLFGEERLAPVLERQSQSAATVEETVRAVIAAVNAFADGAPASDDMTVLGVRYTGKG